MDLKIPRKDSKFPTGNQFWINSKNKRKNRKKKKKRLETRVTLTDLPAPLYKTIQKRSNYVFQQPSRRLPSIIEAKNGTHRRTWTSLDQISPPKKKRKEKREKTRGGRRRRRRRRRKEAFVVYLSGLFTTIVAEAAASFLLVFESSRAALVKFAPGDADIRARIFFLRLPTPIIFIPPCVVRTETLATINCASQPLLSSPLLSSPPAGCNSNIASLSDTRPSSSFSLSR